MIRALLLLAWRFLGARPLAAAVTVWGVAAGVAAVRAMNLGSDGAIATWRAVFVEAAGPASWVVVAPGGGPLPAGTTEWAESQVEAALPAVVTTTVRLQELRFWMGVVLPEGTAGLTVIGVDPGRERGWGRWRVKSGAEEPAEDGVLVGAAWAQARGLEPGGRVQIVAGQRVLDLPIRGLITREGLGARAWGRVVLADIRAVRGWFGLADDAVHELALVTREDRAPTPPPAGATLSRPRERGDEVAQKLANLRAGTELLGGVTLLLAALVVAGQFSARAAARAQILALVRTIGASRAVASATLLVEAGLLGLVGSALGVLLGGPLAVGVAWALGQGVQAELHVDLWSTAGASNAFFLGCGVTVLAVGGPAWAAGRGEPLDALRGQSATPGPAPRWMGPVGLLMLGVSALMLAWHPPVGADRVATLFRVGVGLVGMALLLPALISPLSRLRNWVPAGGVATRLGLAGLGWRPIRTGLAAATVALALGLVGGVGAINAGLRVEMERWSRAALGWDWYLSQPAGLSPADVEAITNTPGVQRALPLSVLPLTVHLADGRIASLSLLALDPEQYAEAGFLQFPADVTGGASQVAALADDHSVLVSSVVAAQWQLAEGARLQVACPTGSCELAVRGVVVDYTQNGFVVVGSRGLARRLGGVEHADVVVVRGGSESTLCEAPGRVCESREELRRRVGELVSRSLTALDLLLVLGGLIGVLAVGAAIGQGAVERLDEIALLRLLGLAPEAVPRLFWIEAGVTCALGVVVGIPLGVALGWVFSGATRSLGIPVPLVTAWGAMGLCVALLAVTSAATAAWVGRRAARRVIGSA